MTSVNLILATIYIVCQGIVLPMTDAPIPFELISTGIIIYSTVMGGNTDNLSILNLTAFICLMMASSYAVMQVDNPVTTSATNPVTNPITNPYSNEKLFDEIDVILWKRNEEIIVMQNDRSLIDRFIQDYSNEPEYNSLICFKSPDDVYNAYLYHTIVFTSKGNIIQRFENNKVLYYSPVYEQIEGNDESKNAILNDKLVYFLDVFYGNIGADVFPVEYNKYPGDDDNKYPSSGDNKYPDDKTSITRPWINIPQLGYALTISIVVCIFIVLHLSKFHQNLYNFPSLTLIILLISLSFNILNKLPSTISEVVNSNVDFVTSIICILILILYKEYIPNYVHMNEYNYSFIKTIAVVANTIYINRHCTQVLKNGSVESLVKSMLGGVCGLYWHDALNANSTYDNLLMNIMTFISLLVNTGAVSQHIPYFGVIGMITIPIIYMLSN